ncbi:recombinase family protein [Albidovulum sediminicola]|uniref:Recombinase family protein n=1 Tax=Albidovulum sediminicola TaxID=2984331 RepID=A0ABT2YXF1_9RHOB|nr:recombinase family protein [Defluviimonas sp. WL0075]MCV2863526.1 recombinase family protein [Defluviimonas sp. WL0075]
MPKIRCAIYTRKSSEEGLEQEFNSLHAQREACAAYVASQKAEGWVLLPAEYDDGGISGGTLERPALQRLLRDIDEGLVDQIVVYKIDRLTRSLADFAKIVDRLDAAGASFVSVTQSFNTATSMGRLTLNMLLSFAQFEREVTAERIRDKIAASKRKGLWMGGQVPLGYEAEGRTLRINEAEARTVRTLYDLYDRLGTVRGVKAEADRLGLVTKVRSKPDGSRTGGLPYHRGHLWQLLTNPVYAGRIRHRGQVHEGQHPAIIPPEDWEALQVKMQGEARKPRARGTKDSAHRSLLAGRIFDETGDRLTPSHAKTKAGHRLRYYVSHRLIKKSGEAGVAGWRLPGPELEALVLQTVRRHLDKPAFIPRVLPQADAAAIGRVRSRLADLMAMENDRPLFELVERLDVAPGQIALRISAQTLGKTLGIDPGQIDPSALSIAAPFRSRKRGVETKLILNGTARPVDQVLLVNIARAHAWFAMIREGRSYEAIARATGTSRHRVQQMLHLAFLAPDIVRSIAEGRQPAALTTKWLTRHPLPSDWQAQRAILATL